jgi:hypothetical protein
MDERDGRDFQVLIEKAVFLRVHPRWIGNGDFSIHKA